jgi:anti-sigma B factor antagonist
MGGLDMAARASGLRALLETRQRLERASRRLALVLSTPGVLRIFQITALDDVFEIHPSLGAAVDVDGAGIALGDQVG